MSILHHASAPDNAGRALKITRLTATGKGIATKKHGLNDGQIVTDSVPQVFAGSGEVLTLPLALEGLAGVIQELKSNQCLTYGVPKNGAERFTLVTKKERSPGDPPDVLARCRDDFGWSDGYTIFFSDYDPGPSGVVLPPEVLVNVLAEAVPQLRNQRFLFWPSSSSYIKGPNGEELRGLCGYHLYTIIRAKHVEPFAAYLKEALAAAGHVRYEVSAAGSLLERYPVDFAVHQPERIDFAAPPLCLNGLQAFGREPYFIGGSAA
jgi:hypothetical protein